MRSTKPRWPTAKPAKPRKQTDCRANYTSATRITLAGSAADYAAGGLVLLAIFPVYEGAQLGATVVSNFSRLLTKWLHYFVATS